jgi:hypothetical protein
MTWTGYERKLPWPNLRHYPGLCLQGLRIAVLWGKISTEDLQIMEQ